MSPSELFITGQRRQYAGKPGALGWEWRPVCGIDLRDGVMYRDSRLDEQLFHYLHSYTCGGNTGWFLGQETQMGDRIGGSCYMLET